MLCSLKLSFKSSGGVKTCVIGRVAETQCGGADTFSAPNRVRRISEARATAKAKVKWEEGQYSKN